VIAVFIESENPALGPLPGAENVTSTPLSGFPNESNTAASRTAPKNVFTIALCGVPPTAVMLAGVPGVLVRRIMDLACPGTLGFTE